MCALYGVRVKIQGLHTVVFDKTLGPRPRTPKLFPSVYVCAYCSYAPFEGLQCVCRQSTLWCKYHRDDPRQRTKRDSSKFLMWQPHINLDHHQQKYMLV